MVSWALANALNALYPDWNLAPIEAFLLVYGGTVTFVWTGEEKTYGAFTGLDAEDNTKISISIYDTRSSVGAITHKVQWIIHELGHAFSQAVGGTTENTQAFLDNNPRVGRDGLGNYTGYAGDTVDGSLYWQQNYSTAANEQFADMFIGWVYGQWQLDDYGDLAAPGIAMSNFMNGTMPYWLNLVVQQ